MTRKFRACSRKFIAHGHGRHGGLWANVDCPACPTITVADDGRLGAAWARCEMGGMFSRREGGARASTADDYEDSRLYENPTAPRRMNWTGELPDLASDHSPKKHKSRPKPTSKG